MRVRNYRVLIAFFIGSFFIRPVCGETVDYLRDIRPILSDNCYACHGPDQASREADLRLDQIGSATTLKDADHATIVPGSAGDSQLIRRIESTDPDLLMPPSHTGKSLSQDEIALIRQWIDDGAAWKQHWAFATPQRPEVPQGESVSPIDRFVQAKLRNQNVAPSPRAEKEILIRRVTFDLTGLPPTLEEVDAYLRDESPEAYQKVVDRLLSSRHYGEHMARYWLDAARYGDTHGLHLDNYREMWPYRDWVIKAFNDNMPFDQFVTEQLAGDLLLDATLEQQIATGFCRAHVSTNEGGSIEQEVFTRNVVDRVSTFGTVFLGLTLECCSCHDHKFDPISQKEFYQLFAFFNSLDGPAMDGNVKDPAPVVSVPSPSQRQKINLLESEVAELESKRDTLAAERSADFTSWLKSVADDQDANDELTISDALVVHCTFDEKSGTEVLNHAQAEQLGRLVGAAERVQGSRGSGVQLSDGGHVDLGNVASFDDSDAFSFGLWVNSANGRNRVVLGKTDASKLHRGYELSLLDGRVTVKLSRRQPGYVIKVTTQESVVPTNQWRHVFVTYDGTRRASGVTIYIDGQAQPVTVWSDALQFKGGIRNKRPLLIGTRDQGRDFQGTVDDVRVYSKRLTDAEVHAIYLENSLTFVATHPQERWTEDQVSALSHFYMLNHNENFNRYTERLSDLLTTLQQEKLAIPTTLVYRELATPRDAYVLQRGEYDKPAEAVDRHTPSMLPPMSSELPRNRLGLALWLLDDANPLISRVTVNRFWQQLFGSGLVETSEDFGNQGALPTHPQLLDWLATEFRDCGWDVKALMKLLVMSDTYRQSSKATPEMTRSDPKNRYLARGPRFRLDAEMLRDQSLAVSGLLVPTVGGPSVKPPQPKGLWLAVGFSSSNTVEFIADTDPQKIHRRSLYVFHKRTSPPPVMSTFDVPSRESSCVRRERTNTPLQSLLLMNDSEYVGAALSLAQRVMKLPLQDPRERAALMYRLCTSREADADAIDELVQFYALQLERYQADRMAAELLLSKLSKNRADDESFDASEHAAWTLLANLILNLDEVVTKN